MNEASSGMVGLFSMFLGFGIEIFRGWGRGVW